MSVSPRRHTRRLVGRWVIVIRELPLGLGYLVRLEDPPVYRGPKGMRLVGVWATWWWKPTHARALSFGYDEVFRAKQEWIDQIRRSRP